MIKTQTILLLSSVYWSLLLLRLIYVSLILKMYWDQPVTSSNLKILSVSAAKLSL